MLQNKEKVERASYFISNSYFELIKKELAFLPPIIRAEPEQGGSVRVRLTSVAEKSLNHDRALFAEGFHLLKESKPFYDGNEKESLSLLLARSLKVSWLKYKTEALVETLFGVTITFLLAVIMTSLLIAAMISPVILTGLAPTALLGMFISVFMLSATASLDDSLLTKSISNREQLVSKINELKKLTSEEKTTAILCQDRVPKKVDDLNPDFILASEQESKLMAANSHAHEQASPTPFFSTAKPEQDETPHASTLSFSLERN